MEDILQKIIKEGSSEKFAQISIRAHKAYEFLESNPCGGPPENYRQVVLDVVRPALESGNSRIVSLGVSCLQRVVRDDRFHSRPTDNKGPSDEESWLTVQVLAAVHPINSLSDEHQQEILKVLLALSCAKDWKLNGRIVVQILSLCLDVFNKGVAGVKAACQATSSQTLVEYGKHLSSFDGTPEQGDLQHNDAITVCQFLCAKLDEGIKDIKSGSKTEISLVLHCLLILIRSLPVSISGNSYFSRFLWQRFNPTFLVYLGLPETSSSANSMSWISKKKFKLDQKNIQLMYTISVELVRVLGGQPGLRPVLESIFHRMLNVQGSEGNVLAFRALKEYLLSKEDRILTISMASFMTEEDDDDHFDNMAIFKLLANALESNRHVDGGGDIQRKILILDCFHSLLSSLEKITDARNNQLKLDIADRIINLYPYLEVSDYEGPIRYDYKERLPTHFVDVIENGSAKNIESKNGANEMSSEKELEKNHRTRKDENDESPEEVEPTVISNKEDPNGNAEACNKKTGSEPNTPEEGINEESKLLEENESNKMRGSNETIEVKENQNNGNDENSNEKVKEHEDVSADNLKDGATIANNNEECERQTGETDHLLENDNSSKSPTKIDQNDEENQELSGGSNDNLTIVTMNEMEFRINEDQVEEPQNDKPSTCEDQPNTCKDKPSTCEDISKENFVAQSEDRSRTSATHLSVPVNPDVDNASSNQSSDSEDTEGPEEGFDNDDESSDKLADCSKDGGSYSRQITLDDRQSKLPQKLMSNSELAMGMEEEEHLERENAQIFLKSLKDELKYLTSARGSIEIDQRLQEFASKYCHEYSSLSSFNPSRTKLILNADGVYITSYAALHLNMKLASLRAYSAETEAELLQRQAIPTRDRFVDSILGCGLLIFLSPIWLDEIYHTIREIDIFGFGIGGSSGSMSTTGLKNVLSDLDGFGSTAKGARLLSDCRRLGPQQQNQENSDDGSHVKNRKARERLSRRILTTVWSSFISCLNSSLKIENGSSITQTTNGSNQTSSIFAGKVVKTSGPECQLNEAGIRCLLTATRLCSRLELHTRVGEVLAPLSQILAAVASNGLLRKSGSSASTGVSASSILAMETIIEDGLELGSQAEDCWKHIMRLATFIISANNVCQSGPAILRQTKKEQQTTPRMMNQDDDDDNLHLDSFTNFTSNSLPLFLSGMPMSGGGCSDMKSVKDVLEPLETDGGKTALLNNEQFYNCVNTINSRIERFFEEAAAKLDMDALLGFLRELCFCSHRELLTITSSSRSSNRIFRGEKWSKRQKRNSALADTNLDALLLHRICDVMLKAIKTGRPLVHLIKAWAIVGPHLIEASSHPLFDIAKRSVDNIHGIVTSFLQNTSELIYFHFNEALFKPFEHLVRLEICDQAIQDQIVSSICEFVESNGVDIRSGWRPLFGALKHITFSDAILDELIPVKRDKGSNTTSPTHVAEPRETRAVLDVFDAFLSIESPHVFANAALDCIGCLVRHVRGSEERRQLEEIVEIENNLINHQGSIHLGRACLTYLLHCHEILIRISRMPQRPVFAGTHRIHASSDEKPTTVDPTIPYMRVISFDAATDTIPDLPFTFEGLQTTIYSEENLLLKDNAHGLFRLWFILVDGLCSCVSICGKGYQSSAIESLFAILASFQSIDEQASASASAGDAGVALSKEQNQLAEFGLFLTNHVLLPMLQNWLRRCGHFVHEWTVSAPSFKQCMGKTTELVMTWFSCPANLQAYPDESVLVLKQLLLLLIECTVVPVESIARLGCSCFRHSISCGGPVFNSEMWDIVCLSLCRAIQVTLYPLHQLMAPFERGSSNFYGDVADVKVAARRDSNRKENHRLQQLAQQVLLLEQQRGELPKMPANPEAEERSFLFLLHPPGPYDSSKGSGAPLRVALRSLLTGLTANQLLLQIAGKVLLQGTKYSIPGLSNILIEGEVSCSSSTTSLPGYLSKLTTHQIKVLITSLKTTYEVAMEFDSRPGLKFLLQKVTQLDNAANLYKTAGAAWSLSTAALFHLSLRYLETNPEALGQIKSIMLDRLKERNTCFVNQDPIGGSSGDRSKDISPAQLLVDLHDQFIDIVETYADIAADKDGQRARLDNMVRQKLYFLSIEPPPPEDASPCFSGDVDSKPFKFADFACQSIRKSSLSQMSDLESEAPNFSLRMEPQMSMEEEEEVFSLTTQTEKDSMVSEFRYKKGKKVLQLSTSSSAGDKNSPVPDRRRNPFSFSRGSATSADPEIAAQQRKSLMADSEAQIKVWTDLTLATVLLASQLSNEQLRLFLPVIFPGLKLALLHAEGNVLKQKLAELFQRIARLYQFTLDLDAHN